MTSCLFPIPKLDYYHEWSSLGPFCRIWCPLWVTPWPLLRFFLSSIYAPNYKLPILTHIMTISALWTVKEMTFAMKIAILTIFTPLVTSLRDPMTPHYHALVMAGCNMCRGSSFSPINDDHNHIHPQKIDFFARKRRFWPFCIIWWPLCATPWPRLTFFCKGQ